MNYETAGLIGMALFLTSILILWIGSRSEKRHQDNKFHTTYGTSKKVDEWV